MPHKGQLTKEHIVHEAAVLFNTKGFSAASMADIMAATGLKKGGIYNHFANKEELLLAAFDHALAQVYATVVAVIRGEKTSLAKLEALISFYRTYPLAPIIEGGCPVLNGTVEADNRNPLLQARVQQAHSDLITTLARVIENGKRYGEFSATTNAEELATIIVITLQGAIGLTRTAQDAKYMEMAADHLLRLIRAELV